MESRIGPIKESTGLVSLIDYGQLVEMTLEDRDNFADFIIAVDGKPHAILKHNAWSCQRRSALSVSDALS